jgi:hypothetical protein
MFWDEYEHDVLQLSCENDISEELGSMNLSPNRVDPKLQSELVEICDVRPESI